MKTTKNILLGVLVVLGLSSCSKSEDVSVANHVTLQFHNTFKDEPIFLGDASSSEATENISAVGQVHRFSELKYVISNIRLVKTEGTETPYNINNLDEGAVVLNHAKPQTLQYVLNNIPSGEYKQLKFGLGVKKELNILDEIRFPKFYAEAGENDTEMMWEWGIGYRFTKIEGFYGEDYKEFSIHTGSTVEDDDEGNHVQGVDAYRDIVLDLPTAAVVGNQSPTITIRADFDKLLSGKTNTITLSSGKGEKDNATPNVHSADQMVKFVDNLGGNGKSDNSGIFSIENVEK